MPRSRRPRLLPLLAVCALAGGFAGGALTAAIPTWPATNAGFGTQPFTGFTVSGVSYTRNSVSPQNVDSVAFTLGPVAAATVKIKFDGNAYSCTGTTSITCATTSPQAHASSAVSVGSLVVVAAQ